MALRSATTHLILMQESRNRFRHFVKRISRIKNLYIQQYTPSE
jgi:hypothetical protein